MGGHGALTLALRNPSLYRSVSAFSPDRRAHAIALGQEGLWQLPGAGHRNLARARRHANWWRAGRIPGPSSSIKEQRISTWRQNSSRRNSRRRPQKSGQQLTLRMQPGYDHGYYFIQTFMADHLRHHAKQLARAR